MLRKTPGRWKELSLDAVISGTDNLRRIDLLYNEVESFQSIGFIYFGHHEFNGYRTIEHWRCVNHKFRDWPTWPLSDGAI
jgi:hypothetical protein